ncbi:MAG: prepilin-type N-terminal cleavage/methylation domain-containing protein [Rickettsiales bacterium]|nr:prepilin-type N-terminal cleavage/methylation domain-containing protein [Rickettsiales bacterium]
MKNKNRAFSLIELSIVILIIGILIAGVTQGSRLVNASKLQTAQTLTQSSPVAGISGLLAWYETSAETSFSSAAGGGGTTTTTDAATLSGVYWNDNNPQTNTGRINLLGAASTSYKSVGINGLPSASFASNNLGFSNATGVLTSPYNAYTVFAVARTTNVTADNAIFYNGVTGTNGFGLRIDSNRKTALVGGGFTTQITTPAAVLNAAQIMTVSVSANSSNGTPQTQVANGYINGVLDTSTAGTAGYLNATNLSANMVLPTGGFRIGTIDGADTNVEFIGDISEIIIFNTVLKTSDRKAVEKYLGQKYGIAVAS